MYFYFMMICIFGYAIGHTVYVIREYHEEKKFIQWNVFVILMGMTLIYMGLSLLYPTLSGQTFN